MLDTLVPHPRSITVRTVMPAAYVIHHVATGKMYIGSSSTPGQRVGFHKSHLKSGSHHNAEFQTAYNEAPELREVIYVVPDREKAFALEQALLDYYMPACKLFNISLDVKSPMKGRMHTAESKALICSSGMGRVMSTTTRELLSLAHKGKQKSPEHMASLHVNNYALLRKAIIAVDITYIDVRDCSAKLGISKSTIRRRISDKTNFPDWHYV